MGSLCWVLAAGLCLVRMGLLIPSVLFIDVPFLCIWHFPSFEGRFFLFLVFGGVCYDVRLTSNWLASTPHYFCPYLINRNLSYTPLLSVLPSSYLHLFLVSYSFRDLFVGGVLHNFLSIFFPCVESIDNVFIGFGAWFVTALGFVRTLWCRIELDHQLRWFAQDVLFGRWDRLDVVWFIHSSDSFVLISCYVIFPTLFLCRRLIRWCFWVQLSVYWCIIFFNQFLLRSFSLILGKTGLLFPIVF